MQDHPQWSERTLDMPPQDPWADPPTTPQPPLGGTAPINQQQPAQPESPFSRGRAQVNQHPRSRPFAAEHEPTGTGWPGADPAGLPAAPGRRLRDLRRGGGLSTAALLFAFVCWGIWALSTQSPFTTSVIIFVVSVLVAGGIFALARLVGRVVLEKQFHRVRRSARGSHLITALFLVGVGLAHLQQTAWVVHVFHWVVDLHLFS
ncbi:MAG: hypothetical protein QOH97_3724 [Actinoplanes sp.]|jgi:hypothetical protein|nr:hypothetical protein [Actinoplanes sp.]